jgi:hypothetical protein
MKIDELTEAFLSYSTDTEAVEGSQLKKFWHYLSVLDEVMLRMPKFLEAMVGVDDANLHRMQKFIVFMWLACMGMPANLLVVRESGQRLRNPVVMATLTRTVQEAFVGLFYFSVEQVTPSDNFN